MNESPYIKYSFEDYVTENTKTGKRWDGTKSILNRQNSGDIFLDWKQFHIETDFVFSTHNFNFKPKDRQVTQALKKDMGDRGQSEDKNILEIPIGTMQINKEPKGNDIILIPFQFFEIKTITDRTATYNSIGDLFSRFENINVWQNTSNLEVELELSYVAMDPKKYNENWVEDMAALFKAMQLPTYYGNYEFSPPPKIYLKIGNLINNIPFIVTKVSREMLGGFTNVDSTIYEDIYKSRKGNYLPKGQKITLSLKSAYSQDTDKTKIDFTTVLSREEGVSEVFTYKGQEITFKGVTRGQSTSTRKTFANY